MNKIFAALLGGLLSTALLLGVSPAMASAAPAAASSAGAETQAKRGIATRKEFRRVKKNMPMQRVHRIFGIGGKQTYFSSGCCGGAVPAYQSREYNAGRYSYVNVNYERRKGTWRVESKYAFWN